ncbi:Gfo/Idh/MocA family oxidoreductase [Microlunatus elymi]|uniref:Gfo/Idh/MocA family oxidoreductase n=2 Tax=Microlunatus elymi TaxID=2596828 RepID=A0A516PYZ5_9ACTN|nr:Gfo/Idh/MocA family oxidoreductase [Microlunatus elymi]
MAIYAAMRIVQVGLGGFGRNWAQEMIPQVTEVQLVGSADVSEESRTAAIAAGVADPDRCFATAEQVIEACDPDAVLVTASLVGHVPAIRAALKAGKHVMTEKPFAPSVEDARELVELAESQDLVLAVSQNYRFFPAVRAVQQIVRSGELGALHAVELDFRRFSGAEGVRGPHHYLDEPLLVDMSIHHFDLLRTVLGRDATGITCRTWDPDWSLFAGPSEGVALIDFDDLTASYRGSWVSHGAPTAWAGEWRMDFADGEVDWTSRGDGKDGWKVDVVSVRRNGEDKRVELPRVPRTDRAGSLTEFARAIAEGRQPENSGRDNLGTLALTYAAVESATNNSTVTL